MAPLYAVEEPFAAGRGRGAGVARSHGALIAGGVVLARVGEDVSLTPAMVQL